MPLIELNSERKWVIGAIFVVFIIIYIVRLFMVQVWDNKYRLSADSNSQRHEVQYPARGMIFDRNGKLLVHNQAAYDLMIIPRQVNDFDTTLFSELLNVDKQLIVKKIKKAKRYSTYKPSIFIKQVSAERYAEFQEHMFKFQGFFMQTRTLRSYSKPIAGHVLGYVGEVNDRNIKKDAYYKSGDYIGISGIEKTYEKQLRGIKGNKIYLVDVHSRVQGEFRHGALDEKAVLGQDLTTTLDLDLQEYGEILMKHKIGSIVAIEPSSGEILALISAPNYDPNQLVGRQRSSNYSKLIKDSLNPLFNRALTAHYPPGSIFKVVNGLIGLDGDFINAKSSFVCDKSIVGCHNHPLNSGLDKAIKHSCNPYFYQVYKRIIQQGTDKSKFIDSRFGLKYWRDRVLSFGLGFRLKLDLPNVSPGVIPGVKFYDKWYGENRWKFSMLASNAIGQGEVMVVPVQMANLAAIVANSGFYYTPHVIKQIAGKNIVDTLYTKKHFANVDTSLFALAQQAMYEVVNVDFGTARRARIDSILVCGKTGTVENPHGEDHSVFIAFAPKEDPKIAIVVYVENSGSGGTWAAPISALMIEKYLNRDISARNKKYKEKRILDFKPLELEQ